MCLPLPKPDLVLDLSGLKCPLPVLRTKKALAGMSEGDVLEVLATDPGSYEDIPAFARMSGHELLDARLTASGTAFLLRR